MVPERIQLLSNRFFAKQCTEEEKEELALWIAAYPDDAALLPLLAESWASYEPDAALEAAIRPSLERLEQRLFPEKKRLSPAKIISYMAAAALLGSIVAGSIWLLRSNKPLLMPKTATTAPIAAGKTGAILTLADGSTIQLDSSGNGTIANEAGASVLLQNGTVVYNKTSNPATTTVTQQNKLQTPHGRHFKLTLPDGSRVWLNAASSIEYPVAFTGQERKVRVTGEAYFEIAPSASQPFIVAGKDQLITVLGTHFNINTYEEEGMSKTTLLEGSISVKAPSVSAQPVILKPRQQAYTDHRKAGISVMNNADIKEVIAWKEGYFVFKDADIQYIMRQAARWYDIHVKYEGNVSEIRLSGVLSRKEDATELFRLLEMTKRVTFSIKGNDITVMPYSGK